MRVPSPDQRVGDRPTPVFLPSPAAGLRDRRPGVSGISSAALAEWFTAAGEAGWRARQVSDAIWSGRAAGFDAIPQLPASLRTRLSESFRADTLVETTVRPADGGLTEKALHRLDDGRTIESVLMRYPARGGRRERATLCISSQAGCAVGCPFCATGELGFWRDLDTAEIIDQARSWRRHMAADGQRVTNIVFMGMGEPLLNTDAVLEAADALSDGARFGLGARHITISTSGVVTGIDRLTALRPQFTLAVSLHAARPALRQLLVPLERRWPASHVVAAATAYATATGRRITYEMVMIAGINDTLADAQAAADLLKGRLAHVNLIPMNPVAHTPWQPSPPERIEDFANVLRRVGLHTTVRRNRGVDIGAACGQLAAELAGSPTPAAVARRREILVDRSATALREAATADAAPDMAART
jgi:23S rRNA (adenine2503-C2)-methyltransferase